MIPAPMRQRGIAVALSPVKMILAALLLAVAAVPVSARPHHCGPFYVLEHRWPRHCYPGRPFYDLRLFQKNRGAPCEVSNTCGWLR